VTLREEDLDFDFDADWKICSHWDQEPVYGDLKDQVPGSKGVDFVGLRAGALHLIEVKDYRTFEKQSATREKLADDGRSLAEIVAAKVRDTVAGVIGAARTGRDPAWKICLESLVGRDLWVVLWIEHADMDASSPVRAKRAKVGAAVTLITSLKKRCRWVTRHVMVCSLRGAPVPGLTVRSIPNATRTRGRRP
jgi:hypothetical protein